MIMQFFREAWKPDHIFAANRGFLVYEFADGNIINFILAIEKELMTIEGLWGYYPFSRDNDFLDVGGGPWSVRAERGNLPFLGMEILKRAKEIINYRTMIGVGDNPETSGFYHKRISKDFVGKLEHYYKLGDCESFSIAKITNSKRTTVAYRDLNIELELFSNITEVTSHFQFERYKEKVPYKDAWYVNKRFFNHPKYKYNVYGVKIEGVVEGIVVMKKVDYNNGKALRIVDYIGNTSSVKFLGKEIERMLQNGFEYIDFYCHGFLQEDLEEAGFTLRTEQDNNIIPNYFEPYVPRNIELGYSSTRENVIICKADADQDRPNFL